MVLNHFPPLPVGKWQGILATLGISVKFKRQTPCPICGGKDRFRFDDKEGRGTFICNRCGAGDGVDLIHRVTGWPVSRVFREVRRVEGTIEQGPITEAKEDAEKRKKLLNDMWTVGKPVSLSDPAGAYLHKRTGLAHFSGVFRFHPSLFHAETKQVCPALLAKVTDADNKPVAIHRTYLAEGIEPRKKLTAGPIPAGSAIRIMPYEEVIGIAEGIETAISAFAIFGVPTWAAISASQMEKWTPPVMAKRVVIFGDNDQSYTGQAAAYKLAHRLVEKYESVKVLIPNVVGADWNDMIFMLGTEKARSAFIETKESL